MFMEFFNPFAGAGGNGEGSRIDPLNGDEFHVQNAIGQDAMVIELLGAVDSPSGTAIQIQEENN